MDLLVNAIHPLCVKVKGIDIAEDLENDQCEVTFHLRYKRKSMVKFTEAIRGVIRAVPGVKRILLSS